MGKLSFFWVAAGALCCTVAVAADWTVEPAISISETFTDNLQLGGGNSGPPTEEFITEIEPSIAINAIGKRFEIDLNYRLQRLLYSKLDQLDESLNYAKTSGMAKLIGESVLVDFSGSLNQQTVNPGRRIGISAITPGNRTEVGNLTVRPYLQKKFGGTGNIVIGYQYGLVNYDRNLEDPAAPPAGQIRLVGSTTNGVYANISGAAIRSPFSWKLDATDREIDYDSGARVNLQRIGAELAWAFGKTAVFVTGGDENNSFNQLLPGSRKIDGSFWSIGLRGQLDRLTTYSISAGQQHFGDSYQFSLIREAGQLTTNISYLEETTTIGQQQQGYEALFEYLSNITGADLPTPGAEVYVRKSLSVAGTLTMPRSRLKLNAKNSDRTYLTTFFGSSDGVASVSLSWTWTAFERTELSIDAGWQAFELRANSNNPEDIRLQLRLKREMKRGLSANFRAWRNSRSGSTSENEYSANAVSIGIAKKF